MSGAIFPYPVPTGQHGFPFPGQMTDQALRQCTDQCTSDDCGCDDVQTFDTGFFMFNMLGRWFGSHAREMPTDLCLSSNDCSFLPARPQLRDRATLD